MFSEHTMETPLHLFHSFYIESSGIYWMMMIHYIFPTLDSLSLLPIPIPFSLVSLSYSSRSRSWHEQSKKKSPSESCTQVETEKLTRWSDVIIRKKDDLSNFCGKKSRYFCMLDCLTISWWLGAMWLTDSLAHVREPRSFGGEITISRERMSTFWLISRFCVYQKLIFKRWRIFFTFFSFFLVSLRLEQSCGKRWICLDWPITAINNEHDVSVSFSSACYIRFVFNRHRHHHLVIATIGCYFWKNPVERYLKCHGM